MNNSSIDISIICVTWNAKEVVRKCLDSVIGYKTGLTIETIIVDNGSTDGLIDMIKDEFPQMILIENGENLGFAAANNIGMRRARGRYFCLINSDIILLPGCLEELTDYLETNSHAAIVSPLLANLDGSKGSTLHHFPTLWNTFTAAVWLDTMFPRIDFFSGSHYKQWRIPETIGPVDVIAGAFWFARREAVEKVGMLDERFFFYTEDIDWCRRFKEAGWQVVFHPEARAIHHHAASSSAQRTKYYVQQRHTVIQYWQKYHGDPGKYAVGAILALGQLLRLILSVPLYLLQKTARSPRSDYTRARLANYTGCLSYVARNIWKTPARMMVMEEG